MVQTLRAGFYSLLHRQAYKGVHNLVPPEVLPVPKFVLLHIAKSGKFIPTRRSSNVKDVLAGIGALKRQLLLRNCFQRPPSLVSKCRLKSTWEPPGNAGVVRLLSHELTQFEPKAFKPNQSWFDQKAKAWLRQHSDMVAVVDCDKGLGDCLVLRSWLVQQVQLQLAQGYVQINPEDVRKKMAALKFGADAMVQFFHTSGVISHAERAFLLSKFHDSLLEFFAFWSKCTSNRFFPGLFAIFVVVGLHLCPAFWWRSWALLWLI